VWPLQVLLFFAILGAAFAIIETPIAFYSGFVLPHRFGQSNQTRRDWLKDLAKGGAVAGLLGVVSVEVLYGFLRATPATWWVWTGVAYTALAVVLTTVAPVVLLPLFFKLSPLRDQQLAGDIEELARRAGSAVQDVCELNLSSKTPAANAAVIGLGRTRKIVLGDTLLDRFPGDEVEVVVAHELGHHVHGDLVRGLALSSVLTLAGFAAANVVLHAAVGYWHFRGAWDLGAFPILAASLGVWGAATGAVERAFSRRLEANADSYSLHLTNLADAFVRSEIRLTNQNLAWYKPPALLEALFYTHPAPWRRVEMGERYARSAGTGPD
jgi:STE24 endopeptidase